MKVIFGLVLVVFLSGHHASANSEDDFENQLLKVVDEAYWQSAEAKEFQSIGQTFECDTSKYYPKATSVHELRPSDIEIIAAFGDSITAANGAGAKTIVGVATNYRGISWTIGGEKSLPEVFTIPNVLKEFNPTLRGFALGSGKVDSANAQLNCAVAGSTQYMIYDQVVDIVARVLAMPNSMDQWKMVSLFIGGNDLCQFCNDREKFSAQNYTNHIAEALDYLHQYLPKTFVNLVQTLNVASVNELPGGVVCKLAHDAFCKCALNPDNLDTVNKLAAEFQKMTNDLAASGRYDTHDQFTVVAQPFMTKMTAPKTADNKADYSYFAPDCFHFSRKGHEAAALELWNSMLIPVGQKPDFWKHMNQQAICPTDEVPYFYTNKNSMGTKVAKQSLKEKLMTN